jgi:hypothetical protein
MIMDSNRNAIRLTYEFSQFYKDHVIKEGELFFTNQMGRRRRASEISAADETEPTSFNF